jgi:hypothetical protein
MRTQRPAKVGVVELVVSRLLVVEYMRVRLTDMGSWSVATATVNRRWL